MTSKKGILLMNLGSPDSTKVKDLRKYLGQFLMDERVIDQPWLLRALLVKGIIVPFRAPKSAEAYKTIWTDKGSPLIEITRQLKTALEEVIEEPVEIAMRYGSPGTEEGFNSLLKRNPSLEEVVALPLYPHYAMSSYETAVEYAKEIHKKKKYSFKLSFVKPFFDEPDYLNALAENIRPYLSEPYDQVLFSYHGIPERHIRKSDVTGCHCLQVENCCEVPSTAHAYCYRHQVFTTTKRVTEILNIPKDKYSISFQSRLGKGWLTPFTDVRLQELPAEGIKKLLILCPAFVSDCLETLEEINIRGREEFMNAGGELYTMIPCLNVSPLWVKAIAKYVTGNRD
ncbi:ferrochelatase [Ginsengibacter hankyongi]|uniref:Ferrochelatase n=1 Tax=Ginsengibacter hankyongi TaxID=2607284 RepID=A0A5J5IHB2_9BACT|nr:ferrochelatase [Ginsengibacter hankyongi]KAA9039346.1 ferrochelatase [Ginsengibacter hankyongi]